MLCMCYFILLDTTGPLDAPTNVRITRNYTTNTTTITWRPPFSLDLTNIDPDIVYCIEVYSITMSFSVRELVVIDCNVTEPSYHSNILHPSYIYNITITPRSNVEGSLNGTSANYSGGTLSSDLTMHV